MDVLAPLIIAATGVPALVIAGWSGRDGSDHARGTGLRWALIALSMFAGALGLYLSSGNQRVMYAMAIALVVAVNVLGVSLVLHLRRGSKQAPRR